MNNIKVVLVVFVVMSIGVGCGTAPPSITKNDIPREPSGGNKSERPTGVVKIDPVTKLSLNHFGLPKIGNVYECETKETSTFKGQTKAIVYTYNLKVLEIDKGSVLKFSIDQFKTEVNGKVVKWKNEKGEFTDYVSYVYTRKSPDSKEWVSKAFWGNKPVHGEKMPTIPHHLINVLWAKDRRPPEELKIGTTWVGAPRVSSLFNLRIWDDLEEKPLRYELQSATPNGVVVGLKLERTIYFKLQPLQEYKFGGRWVYEPQSGANSDVEFKGKLSVRGKVFVELTYTHKEKLKQN